VSDFGALSRRRLLGAGALAGATTFTGVPAAGAARPTVSADSLQPMSAPQSKLYAGLTLMAGNELASPTSTVFVKDPSNGSYPSTVNGYVGAALDVPAGSVVSDVVFFLYQQDVQQQLCAVQLYHPAATTAGW
jgi:hypothetical protein